ncbi:hypothetical protein NL108_017613 [Boleophthalmus pectinirostris]|uniref:E3 ubiquitin/ISG15 ligase TRIM25-like n=1 Tax=Boleophthalmus pectinirostris TaxID=150288 RepID=UPI00242DE27B|nr:E3 ubiquitin/ISG15 ligase TRIM25-like [Boleophthalmus pectinirostris]KAJ0059425.1 hypothetical protein NL108_017613 [Boleophthalmus pectinirostris]
MRTVEGPRCPQCRQRFDPRPRLALNTVLAELSHGARERDGRGGEDLRTHQGTVSGDQRCVRVLQREVLTALQTTELLLQHLLHVIELKCSELQSGTGTTVQQGLQEQTQEQPPGQTQLQLTGQTRLQPPGQTQLRPPGPTQEQPPEQTQTHLGSPGRTQLEQRPPGQPHQENLLNLYTNHLNFNQSLNPSSYPPGFLTDISSAVSEFWQKLQPFVSEGRTSLPKPVPEPRPRTREELLQYSRSVHLDPNSANHRVLLSQGNTRATLLRDGQDYGRHRDRFTDCAQVLSTESLSGRSYLEVEWSGWGFYLALVSKTVPRSGEDSRFGSGDGSWALHCEKSGYELVHRGLGRSLSGPRSSRVAVFVDQAAGQLSFYSLTPHLHLLHTTSTGPSQPLALGVRLYSVGDYVNFCQLQEGAQVSG